MRQPIVVEVREGAAFIRYGEGIVASTLDLMPSCSVAADVDAGGEVLGIEVLDVASGEQVEVARQFARERDLAFPRNLAGVLASA